MGEGVGMGGRSGDGRKGFFEGRGAHPCLVELASASGRGGEGRGDGGGGPGGGDGSGGAGGGAGGGAEGGALGGGGLGRPGLTLRPVAT